MVEGKEDGNGVPVIDMENFPQEPKKLIEACEEWGCFRIINHRISTKLMSEMKVVVRSLLDLPSETKRRNTDVIAGSGYMAPSEKNPVYEALGLYDIANPDAVHAFCHQLDASPHQREVIKLYSSAFHELIMEIGGKLGESMGLKSDFVKEWPCQFRINKYNFTEETVGCSGVQMHTDSGFLTILQGDECVSGLEVMNESADGFISVDPSPGSLIINLGDIAKAWSNGRFKNVKHRVQCKETAIRVSIALFLLGPPGEETVEAPMEFIDLDNPRLYVPFANEDYRKLRISKIMHAGEALEFVCLPTCASIKIKSNNSNLINSSVFYLTLSKFQFIPLQWF